MDVGGFYLEVSILRRKVCSDECGGLGGDMFLLCWMKAAAVKGESRWMNSSVIRG